MSALVFSHPKHRKKTQTVLPGTAHELRLSKGRKQTGNREKAMLILTEEITPSAIL